MNCHRHFMFLKQSRMIKLNKKITLKSVIYLMIFNIIISVLILFKKPTTNIYFMKLNKQELLLDVSNLYRGFYYLDRRSSSSSLLESANKTLDKLRIIKHNIDKVSPKRTVSTANTELKINDNFFNLNSFISDLSTRRSPLAFHEPKILIDNKNACQLGDTRKVFIVCMIHSHRNNFIRRKTMRDTWLSANKLNILDLVDNLTITHDLNTPSSLEIVHMFIIGSDKASAGFEKIKHESDLFNDIILIDTVDNYQNLVYKHLTLINWLTENCADARYVLKLDDDVFVNIKPLSKHLIGKFGVESPPPRSHFMYCSICDQALPVRLNESKWHVSYENYPFQFYPRYCEGFSYITNIATIRLMQQQSKIIPRFWIDDVYMTGLLLHGMKQIDWFDYNPMFKWSFYDFWDLGNTGGVFEGLYANWLRLMRVKVADYYKSNLLVVLHVQKNNNEVNYELTNEINQRVYRTNKINMCFLNNLDLLVINDANLLQTELANKCNNTEKISFHFYEFCSQLWQVN